MRVVPVAVLLLLAGCLSGGGPQGDADPSLIPGPRNPDRDLPDDRTLAATGRWLAPFEGDVPAINMVLLHNGRILYWSGVEADPGDGDTDWTFFTAAPLNASTRVLDLSGPTPVILEPVNPDGAASDLFCAGQTVLPDGRVLAVGSSVWSTQPLSEFFLHGGTDARIYDPATNTWERKADMTFGRWYPSIITLPDGKALVASGIGSLTDTTQQWPQMEVYDPANDTWTYVQGGDRLLPLYPRITVVPDRAGGVADGVFYNTLGTLWGPFGEHPEQFDWSMQAHFNLDAPAWMEEARSIFGARQHGASVMLPLREGEAPTFVNFGGTLYQSIVATPFVELVDLGTNPPTNTMLDPMNSPRWHHNGVLLPTGEVLAVGGGLYDNVILHGQQNVPVMEPELFDPATQSWTTLAPMTVPRMYHSTAVLLPDGRVLAGGHVPLPNPFPQARDTVNPQIVETRFEIFEPPYLFRGDRPVITEGPRHVPYGGTSEVRVEGDVTQFILMRPGATTHAYDADQRAIVLDWDAGDDPQVHFPSDPYVAPPGWYMLFAIGDNGNGPVPSVAHWVHVL